MTNREIVDLPIGALLFVPRKALRWNKKHYHKFEYWMVIEQVENNEYALFAEPAIASSRREIRELGLK